VRVVVFDAGKLARGITARPTNQLSSICGDAGPLEQVVRACFIERSHWSFLLRVPDFLPRKELRLKQQQFYKVSGPGDQIVWECLDIVCLYRRT
jgi:hypothetical protein